MSYTFVSPKATREIKSSDSPGNQGTMFTPLVLMPTLYYHQPCTEKEGWAQRLSNLPEVSFPVKLKLEHNC